MATGDALTPTIQANGYQIVIDWEGMAAATIEQDATKDLTVSCTGEHGFNSSGAAVTNLTRTGIKMKFRSAVDNGGNARCTYDLEEWVHSNGTWTLDADAATMTDGTNSSTATVGQSVTNNSTNAYAIPACQVVSETMERVVSTFDVDVVAGAGAYKGHRENYGIACVEVTACEAMVVSGITGTPTTAEGGETITGGTSGTTATMVRRGNNNLYLTDINGEWTASETITGSTSGFTATYVSGGRKATKIATTMTARDRVGTYGHKAQYDVFRVSFDVSADGDFGASAIVDKKWFLLDVKAKPKIGTSHRQAVEAQFADPPNDYPVKQTYFDPRGEITLTAALGADLNEGDLIISDASVANQMYVNQAYTAGHTGAISVSFIKGTWASADAFTVVRSGTSPTGTIDTVTWNGDDTNDGLTTATPTRTLFRACRVQTIDTYSLRSASWNEVLHMGGRASMIYDFGNRFGTQDGPVIIKPAPGVSQSDAKISGVGITGTSTTRGGLRTNMWKAEGVTFDFKFFGDLTTNSGTNPRNNNLGVFSEGASFGSELFVSDPICILDGCVAVGNGKLTTAPGLPEFWISGTDFSRGVFLRNTSFSEFNNALSSSTTMIDSEAHNCSGDVCRPLEKGHGANKDASLGNATINCNMRNLSDFETGTHTDIYQFVGGPTRDYENNVFYGNRVHDITRVQLAPFFNAGTQAASDATWLSNRSGCRSTLMALNIQESEDPGSANIMQIDDAFVEDWFAYNNFWGEPLEIDNRTFFRNSWWVRNYLDTKFDGGHSSPGQNPMTGFVDNHLMRLYNLPLGFDETRSFDTQFPAEGAIDTEIAALFDDVTTTYKPKSGGTLDARGYTDPIMPNDVDGTAWPTDGTASITALQTAAATVETVTGQVEADGTVRINSTRSSGLWGDTITVDNSKITEISQTTGGARSVTVGSVSGAGGSTLQIILTPDPVIYSTASGGAVTVTIGEGWLTDENGNTTAAFSGIDDGDNSSTQTPPSTVLRLTRGRGGGSVSQRFNVRVINR